MSQPSTSDASARLRQLADLLRAAPHLGPEMQASLADLMEELSNSLGPAPALSDKQAHLADSAAHLADALRQQKDAGLLAHAKKRLEEAAIRTEGEAPVATGVVQRLIDTLANLGI